LWLEELSRSGLVLVDAEMRESEGTEEPTPGCALVIRSITFAGTAEVVRYVAGFARTETTQAYRSEELGAANINDRSLLHGIERAHWQGDRENLIGAKRSVVADTGRIDDVVAEIAI